MRSRIENDNTNEHALTIDALGRFTIESLRMKVVVVSKIYVKGTK